MAKVQVQNCKSGAVTSEHPLNKDPKIRSVLAQFLQDPSTKINRKMFCKSCPIDFSDPNFELVPEYYLDQSPPTNTEVQDGVEQVIRNAAAFLVREGLSEDED